MSRCCGAVGEHRSLSNGRIFGVLSSMIAGSTGSVSPGGLLREAHLPTKQFASGQEAWVSPSDEHSRRSGGAQGPPRQGPLQTVGLIWRIRDRDAFARLSTQGRRVGSGVLWCTFLLDEQAIPPRVAFAIGRAFGSAVARNRLRRRLRALLAGAQLPPGWYLVGARPTAADRNFSELAFDLDRIKGQLQANNDAQHGPGPRSR